MGGYELVVHRQRVQLLLHLLVPDVLAFLSFVGGIVLLFSGATPALRQLWWLGVLVPLPLIELPPFAASLAGITLLLLARGLQRRFDGAYWLTVAVLGAGIVASLYKGWDYEEACVLAVFLAALIPCRREFYRRAALFSDRFTLTWISGIGIVVLAMLVLTLVTYQDYREHHDPKHLPETARETWWQFELSASAPPLFRAGVAVCVLGLMIVGRQLLQQARQRRHPTPADAEVGRGRTGRAVALHLRLPGAAGRQVAAVRRQGRGLPDVRRERRQLGHDGRPGRPAGDRQEAGPAVPRALRPGGAQTVFYQVYPRTSTSTWTWAWRSSKSAKRAESR